MSEAGAGSSLSLPSLVPRQLLVYNPPPLLKTRDGGNAEGEDSRAIDMLPEPSAIRMLGILGTSVGLDE